VGYERRARGASREPKLSRSTNACAAQIIIIVFDCQRARCASAHLGPYGVRVCSARTSGVSASASYAGALIAIRDLD